MWEMFVLLLVCLLVLAVVPSLERRRLLERKYAHRGLHSPCQQVKENSLDAFRLAVDKGYGIELDVQVTSDNQAVIYHDDSLQRLDQDERLVKECTYAELVGYQVPLLTDVLQMVDGRVEVIVELKCFSVKQTKQYCETVYAILQAYKGAYNIESFNPLILMWFKKHAPQITRGQLIQPIKQYPFFWLGVLLNSLLYQMFTRPHFIAFEVSMSRWYPALWWNKLFGARLVAWTVRSPQQERRGAQAYIFEHYDA